VLFRERDQGGEHFVQVAGYTQNGKFHLHQRYPAPRVEVVGDHPLA
jgi:hypothetical protein